MVNISKNKEQKLITLYNQYVKEICNIKDMTRWALKKTITEKVLNPERTNEQKVLDAMEDQDISAGDKVYLYFTKDEALKLVANYDPNSPDYHVDKLLEKLFKTMNTFENVIDIKLFPNFKLKRNKKLLDEILKT